MAENKRDDLSDLGFVPDTQNDDLSDLGFQAEKSLPTVQPTSPELSSTDNAIQGTADFLRMIPQGASFGFADELVGGAKAAYDVATGPTKLEQFMDAYRKRRDEERARYKEIEERSPTASLLGNVAGGILPALATAGTSAGVQAATAGGRILNAARTGALAGGATGLGASEADLTKGEIKEALGDVAAGATMGGVVGGGIQGGLEAAKGVAKGVKAVGKKLKDLQTVQTFEEARTLGKEGTDIVFKSGKEEVDKQIKGFADKLANKTFENFDEVSKEYGKLTEMLQNSDNTVDVADTVKKLKALSDKLANHEDRTYRAFGNKLKLQLLDYIEGRAKTIEDYTQYTPAKQKAIKSVQQKLEDEAAKAKASAAALGQDLKTNITESVDDQGRKLVTLTKAVDEPIGTGEKLIRNLDEVTTEETPFVKQRAIFEDSPKGDASAQAKLAKLRSQATTEGTDPARFELVRDKQEGFLKVIEKGTKTSKVSTPAEEAFTLESTPDQTFKTTASAKTLIDEGTPGYTPAKVGKVVTKEVREGGASPEAMPFQTSENLQQTLNRFKFEAEGQGLGGVKNELGLAAGEIEAAQKAAIPGLEKAAEKSAAAHQMREMFGLDLSKDGPDMFFNVTTKRHELKPEALQKIRNVFLTAEKEGAGNRIVNQDKLAIAMDALQKIDPKAAAELAPQAEKVGKVAKLMGLSSGANITNPSTYLTKGTAALGNLAGQAQRAIGSKFAEATPEQLKRFGQALLQRGPKGMALAKQMAQVVNKDNVGRNALMFSMQQNPEYRKMIKEFFPGEEDGQQ